MPVTINLSDDLAAQLQSRAALEQMSVEEFAVLVLADAAGRPLDAERWSVYNQRRVALIRKRFSSGLSPDEERELQQLQELADRQVEDLDRRMLEDVQKMVSPQATTNSADAGRFLQRTESRPSSSGA